MEIYLRMRLPLKAPHLTSSGSSLGPSGTFLAVPRTWDAIWLERDVAHLPCTCG